MEGATRFASDSRRRIASLLLIGSLWATGSPVGLGAPGATPEKGPRPPLDPNRYTDLDGRDPYHVSRSFPRLETAQWVGEPGVDAAVVLAVDDMRETAPYEAFLRPIIERLKKIDGRAPISIMTLGVDPRDPRLARWVEEGLSIECHTMTHPCPMLQKGDLEAARRTYEECVDWLQAVPGPPPVAFRVPCMDSRNTPSPRFYSEIFARATEAGNFLRIDSSISVLLTPDDPELPREIVLDGDDLPRFERYLPFRNYANAVDDYPYPWTIGRTIWEFPCVVPSDWAAQHRRGNAHPETVADWKRFLDGVVLKRGVFTLVFHPHGWIRSEQVVDLIDHAVKEHGRRVLFLQFQEAARRLRDNLLGGHPLRDEHGDDNGARLLDLDGDGLLDVVVANEEARLTRLWRPRSRTWVETGFPVPVVRRRGGRHVDAGVRFGASPADGAPIALVRGDGAEGAWRFDGSRWVAEPSLLEGLEVRGKPVRTVRDGRDLGVRFRDADGDGRSDLVAGGPEASAVLVWSPERARWEPAPFSLPPGTRVVDEKGRDAGLRFVDVDDDQVDDVLFCDEKSYSLWLFEGAAKGWSRRAVAGRRGEEPEVGHVDIPAIARSGTDNGGWFRSRALWVQNEETAANEDLVERRAFNDLVAGIPSHPLSPRAALASLRARPGFTVELVAAEPLVRDPVAFDWGHDGSLWVAEMIDYPLGLDGKGKPGGRVVRLRDRDRDGRYDQSELFLDGLPFPNGVIAWHEGVLITSIPDILYAEDTDRDGRADRVEKLYTGFHHGNEQHLVNGFAWGLDNWLWLANGDSGGRVKSLRTGRTIEIGGLDLRIRPDEGLIETVTGRTQFGRVRNDDGDWFGCSNPSPMYQFVLSDARLRRNPHVRYPSSRVYVAPNASRVWPRSRPMPRFNDLDMANRFTSCCGLEVYRDELFGPGYRGNGFVCEPVHNLVSRRVTRREGVAFTSEKAPGEEEAEFLASTDTWFRPARARTGPDGALWVADMYRLVIEHPQYFFVGSFAGLDVRAGSDRGRIYRVRRVGRPPRAIPSLGKLPLEELVRTLESPNGWQRDRAQQLLVHRRDPASVKLLERLAAASPHPLARVHALSSLDGLGRLEVEPVARALADPAPVVRRHAARLADTLRERPGHERLEGPLLALATDPSAPVRLEAAYTLGDWPARAAGRALGRLALESLGDEYLTAAVLSSALPHLRELLSAVLEGARAGDPPARESARRTLLARLLPLAGESGDERVVRDVLSRITRRPEGGYAAWQLEGFAGLLESPGFRDSSFVRRPSRDEAAARDRLLDAARTRLLDGEADEPLRRAAARALSRGAILRSGPGAKAALHADIAALGRLLEPGVAPALQETAVSSLARVVRPEAAAALLAGWGSYSPALRSRVLDALLSREAWIPRALDAIEEERIASSEIDATRRRRLLEHPDEAIRARARALLNSGTDAGVAEALRRCEAALDLAADARRGADVFERVCAVCHRLSGRGTEVGQNLAALTDKSSEALLAGIVDPNRNLDPRFAQYTVVTRDGRVADGILADETGASITLVGQEAKREVILRRDIATIESAGRSLMPEGLEKDLTLQDIADVIAFVQATTPPPKQFPGNQPVVIRAGPDGAFLLTARNCEIRGDSLVYEDGHRNLGYWGSANDQAAWRLEVSRAGEYVAHLRWACPAETAGGTWVLSTPGGRAKGRVAATDSWDEYRQREIARVRLEKGSARISFYSDGKPKGFLLDLRDITLEPAGKE